MSRALQGIKVVELSHVVTGPFCGMLLADMGADVIKIERPGKGEFYRSEGKKNQRGVSLIYPSYNRNKKGVTLNIQASQAKEILFGLIKDCDIFIENYKPGLLKRLGMGYDELKKINPSLIMVSISGFGQTGPFADHLAYDMTITAISGVMSVSGWPDEPMRSGVSMVDFAAGMYGAISALGALRHRENTGEGQYIDISMMETAMSYLDAYLAENKFTDVEPRGVGNRRPNYAPLNLFPTNDGNIMISCLTESHWHKLTELMERKDLIDVPGYETALDRKRNQEGLEKIIADWTKEFSTDELAKKLEEIGIPSAPVLSVRQVIKHPQVIARESILEFDYPEIGAYPTARFVPRFSTLEVPEIRAPLLGEHNNEIYGRLGYSAEEIEKLHKDGVI